MIWEMCVKFDSEIIALSRCEGKKKAHRGSGRGHRKHMEMWKEPGAQRNITMNCEREYFGVKDMQRKFFFFPPFFFLCCLFIPLQRMWSFSPCPCCCTSGFAGVIAIPITRGFGVQKLEGYDCAWCQQCVCLANSTGIKPRLTLAN